MFISCLRDIASGIANALPHWAFFCKNRWYILRSQFLRQFLQQLYCILHIDKNIISNMQWGTGLCQNGKWMPATGKSYEGESAPLEKQRVLVIFVDIQLKLKTLVLLSDYCGCNLVFKNKCHWYAWITFGIDVIFYKLRSLES